MLSNLDDEKTSRAAEFITDWSRLSWRCRNPDVKVLKDITSDRRTDRDTDRRILLSWRNTAKQADPRPCLRDL